MLSSGKRLTEDPIIRCSICLVAAAGSGLEPTPIKNSDVAATVTNQIALLQGTCRFSDADAADAKHEGQEFLRDVEGVRVRTILGHQQPAGKPRLNHVKSRTARGLRELAQMDEHIAVNLASQRRAAPQFAAEGCSAHS